MSDVDIADPTMHDKVMSEAMQVCQQEINE